MTAEWRLRVTGLWRAARTGQDAADSRRTCVQAGRRSCNDSPPLRAYAARARADAQRDRIRGGDGPNDRGKHRGDGS